MGTKKYTIMAAALGAAIALTGLAAGTPAVAESTTSPETNKNHVQAVAPYHLQRWNPGSAVVETQSTTIVEKNDYRYAFDFQAAPDLTVDLPTSSTGKIVMQSLAGTVGLGLPESKSTSPARSDGQGTLVYQTDAATSSVVNVDSQGAVSLNLVIADPKAPTTYRFPLDLPPGARAEISPKGSVVLVTETGKPLAYIATPWAKDAAGTEISTWFQLQGTALIQHVGHDTRNVTYPVVADPYMGTNLLYSVFASSGGSYPPAAIRSVRH